MALLDDGFHCVAKATNGGNVVEATAFLPYTIDLSRTKAEIGIKYIAVTPTWYILNDLVLEVVDSATDEDETIKIRFTGIVDDESDFVIAGIREQLTTPLVKIVKPRNKKNFVVRVHKNTSVRFSSQMSELLGVDEFYINETNKDLDIDIVYKKNDTTSTTDIYYLKSEEIASNFMIDAKQDRIIELLHIPGAETVAFTPVLTYTLLEASLLEKITFTLYNEKNLAVTSDHTDLYIVCHIRPHHGKIY